VPTVQTTPQPHISTFVICQLNTQVLLHKELYIYGSTLLYYSNSNSVKPTRWKTL